MNDFYPFPAPVIASVDAVMIAADVADILDKHWDTWTAPERLAVYRHYAHAVTAATDAFYRSQCPDEIVQIPAALLTAMKLWSDRDSVREFRLRSLLFALQHAGHAFVDYAAAMGQHDVALRALHLVEHVLV
jgi:hypothetical protein